MILILDVTHKKGGDIKDELAELQATDSVSGIKIE